MKNNWDFDESIKINKANIIAPEREKDLVETKSGTDFNFEKFGPLRKFVDDTTITDIDYNGQDLWITNIKNEHWKEDIEISDAFIQNLVQNIANSESKEFNQQNPVLEVETDDLRIAILHKSIALTGTSICIRKTPKVERISEKYAIESKYCSKEILSLLANCIKAHMNIVICGEPRAGKTELAKFISSYIPEGERVITIEDVLEWHYKDLHPAADAIELKVNKDFTYSDGIIASLKQNPSWIMIAETRGVEIKNLIQSLTTGVNGITTLHTDDVRKIPERMINMAEDNADPARLENTIFSFVDVGVLVSLKTDAEGHQYRIIDQICFFSNEDSSHITKLIVDNGDFFRNAMTITTEKKFKRAGIAKPLVNDEIIKRLSAQDFDIATTIDLSEKLLYKDSVQNSDKENHTSVELNAAEPPKDFVKEKENETNNTDFFF